MAQSFTASHGEATMFHKDIIINEPIFKHDGGLRPPLRAPTFLSGSKAVFPLSGAFQLHAANTGALNPRSACQEVGSWIAGSALATVNHHICATLFLITSR